MPPTRSTKRVDCFRRVDPPTRLRVLTRDNRMDDVLDIEPSAVAARLAQGDALVVLDVREPWEFDLASVPNSTLIPMSTLPSAINRLERTAEYAVLCHHGMRSEMAANWMRAQGFSRVLNITGGIDAWSTSVDATIPRY